MTQRFWGRVNKDGPLPDQSKPWYFGLDQCWMWLGALDDDGYGRISHAHKKGRTVRVHRFSFELHGGTIPSGHSTLHRCDNPTCVNPSHLWTGTYDDNNQDMKAKGRNAKGDRQGLRLHPEAINRGEKHHNSTLTEEDVRAIRASTESGRVLAARYGLKNRNTPNLIRSGKSWSHVK